MAFFFLNMIFFLLGSALLVMEEFKKNFVIGLIGLLIQVACMFFCLMFPNRMMVYDLHSWGAMLIGAQLVHMVAGLCILGIDGSRVKGGLASLLLFCLIQFALMYFRNH